MLQEASTEMHSLCDSLQIDSFTRMVADMVQTVVYTGVLMYTICRYRKFIRNNLFCMLIFSYSLKLLRFSCNIIYYFLPEKRITFIDFKNQANIINISFFLDQGPYYYILLSIYYVLFKLKRVEIALDDKLTSKKEILVKLNRYTCFYICTIVIYFIFTLIFSFVDKITLIVTGVLLHLINIVLIVIFLKMGFKYMSLLQVDWYKQPKNILVAILFSLMALISICGDFYRSVIVYVGAYLGNDDQQLCSWFSQIRLAFEWIQLFMLYFDLVMVNVVLIFFAKKQLKQKVEQSSDQYNLSSCNYDDLLSRGLSPSLQNLGKVDSATQE